LYGDLGEGGAGFLFLKSSSLIQCYFNEYNIKKTYLRSYDDLKKER
jgi:hypothetical protein